MSGSEAGLMTVYINPQSSEQFRSIAGYKLADGRPAINVACIFAGNYAAATPPYLRANNNNPPTTNPFNTNIQRVLDDGSVKYLQDEGLKVLLTVTNGWQPVGWSEFTSDADAKAFAQYLETEVVDKYGLDGIDIDDEYSTGAANDTSLIMVTSIMRQSLSDAILSKALYDDLQYFQSQWQGHTLAGNLGFGWEMSYGGDPAARLQPYTQVGMNKDHLSLGFWSERPSPDPTQNVEWLKSNGYAGAMVFAFEEQANVNLMGVLVDAWYGGGNWNPPR
jgi:hypothetical protein